MQDKYIVVPSAVYTGSGVSAWFNTGDQPQLDGQWVRYQVTNVTGVPNALFFVETSPDSLSAAISAAFDGNGIGSPLVNSPGEYIFLFSSKNQYWRFAWTFFSNDPGGGSANSSSSSGQSIWSSSSSGGSTSITMALSLVPSAMG